MKKTLLFVLAASALLLSACKIRSSSSSKTSFSFSRTTDNGTEEYAYSAEFEAGDLTSTNTDVKNETPDDQDEYVNYSVRNGMIHISAPSGDESWWEIVGDTNTMELNGWTVQNSVYYGSSTSLIKDGTAYVIVGRYTKDNDQSPSRYCIFEVNVENSGITGVTDSAVVDDLDDYFKN